MRFSLICPTNDRWKCEHWLLPSLAMQRFRDFEIVFVEATLGSFRSAAAALNAGAAKARGDYLVFLHNDVELIDENVLGSLSDELSGMDFIVAGAAGCRAVRGKPWRKKTFTNLVHGEHKEHPGRSTPLAAAMPCETLDECFFVVPRTVWAKRGILEFFSSWHLYAVEYSLWANVQRQGSVVAVPVNIWHHSSGGSFDHSYYDTLRVLAKMYRKWYPVLHTPMGAWPTNLLFLNLRIFAEIIRRKFMKG